MGTEIGRLGIDGFPGTVTAGDRSESETSERMQTLPDVVQEFATWCCIEINVKKTFLLVTVIDKACRRRDSRSEDKWHTSQNSIHR